MLTFGSQRSSISVHVVSCGEQVIVGANEAAQGSQRRPFEFSAHLPRNALASERRSDNYECIPWTGNHQKLLEVDTVYPAFFGSVFSPEQK